MSRVAQNRTRDVVDPFDEFALLAGDVVDMEEWVPLLRVDLAIEIDDQALAPGFRCELEVRVRVGLVADGPCRAGGACLAVDHDGQLGLDEIRLVREHRGLAAQDGIEAGRRQWMNFGEVKESRHLSVLVSGWGACAQAVSCWPAG